MKMNVKLKHPIKYSTVDEQGMSNWTGEWQDTTIPVTKSIISLTQTDNKVTGTFTPHTPTKNGWKTGTINGTIRGNILTGNYKSPVGEGTFGWELTVKETLSSALCPPYIFVTDSTCTDITSNFQQI
jgi:hypothetical protein